MHYLKEMNIITCRIQRSLNHEQFEMITDEERKKKFARCQYLGQHVKQLDAMRKEMIRMLMICFIFGFCFFNNLIFVYILPEKLNKQQVIGSCVWQFNEKENIMIAYENSWTNSLESLNGIKKCIYTG